MCSMQRPANWSSFNFTGPWPTTSRQFFRPVVALVHAEEFGDASEEWEGAPVAGLPASLLLVGCRDG